MILGWFALGSHAFGQIVIDYTHDNGFFSGNATATAALEAAVADINAVLDLDLGEITNDVTTGTSSGGTQIDFDFSYSYTNPTSGASETINDTTIFANEVRLFVGSQVLGGTMLGQGGPGGAGLAISGTIGSGSVADAITMAETLDQHGRGSGPTMLTLSGTVAGESYSFGIGTSVSNLWFDEDTDNDGNPDSPALLDSNWHFDHTTSVAAGKDDFYSVALHETLHAIGIGGSQSWDDLVSGTDYLGSEVIALHGTGTGIIDGGGGHFISGLMSTRLSDGGAQEVAMDPNITTGTRKMLTLIDVAAIQDIGFSVQSNVSAVPEPSSFLALAIMSSVCVMRRVRKRERTAVVTTH